MRAGRAVGTSPRAAAFCLTLGLLALAAPARAWTEARIETAAAHVDVLDAQRARVSLELGVRVDGGWLTRLELRGLEPELVLDADKPPYVLCEDGRKVAPTVRRDANGQLVLGFPDARTAPRRGRHRLGLVYEAPLATAGAAGSAPTAVWSLPAFLHDLRAATIELRAPAGSTPAQRRHEAPGTVSTRVHAGHVTLALHAEHVPRGVPLELAFLRPELARGQEPAPRQAHTAAASPDGGLAAVALCALVLGLLKRRAVRRLASAHDALAQPLVPLPATPRLLASLLLCAVFATVYPSAPGLALLALVLGVALCLDRLQRRPRSAAAPWPQGTARVVALGRARRVRAARLLGGGAWLDATTPLGATLLASAAALALARPADVWLEALLAVMPLFFTATRLQLPPGRHDALITHLRATRALRAARALGRRTPTAVVAAAAATTSATAATADAGCRAPDRAA